MLGNKHTITPDEELADIAKEDKNLMDIMVSGEASIEGGRRGSCVTASRRGSSRSLSSRAGNRNPATAGSEDGCSKQRAEAKPSAPNNAGSTEPSAGRSRDAKSPSSNSSCLQTLEEKRICRSECSPAGSRDRPAFPFTRRSSQIRPLLSSINASGRAASDDRSDAGVTLDDLSSTPRPHY